MDYISQFAVSLDVILGEDKDTTLYLDSHTHNDVCQKRTIAAINRYPGEVRPDDKCVSVGLHPWHVNGDWKEQLEKMRSEASLPCVCAIGECGLDKCCENDYRQQIEAFHEQVLLAEECGKPMIIHCVKSFQEIMAIHKEMKPQQKWLIHGFRGKPELVKQIMAKGMLVSFGHHYNVNTLAYVASNHRNLYLETDDCGLSIRQIYEQLRHHLSSGSLD